MRMERFRQVFSFRSCVRRIIERKATGFLQLFPRGERSLTVLAQHVCPIPVKIQNQTCGYPDAAAAASNGTTVKICQTYSH